MYRIIWAAILFTTAVAPGWPREKEARIIFDVCHDFGCRQQTTVRISAMEWASVVSMFGAETPRQERRQIRRAIGHMEHLAGLYSPLARDLAGNAQPLSADGKPDRSGQLDCIDEAVNVTRFLRLFENTGLLQFHRVLKPAYRRALFSQHWAGHVEDKTSGKRYVYDTWFEDNGELPVLVTSEHWHDLSFGGMRSGGSRRNNVSTDPLSLSVGDR